MKRRMNLMTWVGIVLALLAAIGIYTVLSQHQSTTQVVVARTYIPPRTQLQASMVTVASVPTSDLPPNAITPNKPSVGYYSTTALFPGQILVSQDVAVSGNGGEAGLLGDLAPGDRAFSIQVSAASAASGLILPGDLVDVIVVASGNSGGLGPHGPRAITVVQHVEVLGSSSVPTIAVNGPSTQSASTQSSSSSSSPSSSVVYTLALTPQQVQMVALAANMGTLYLSLDPLNPTIFTGSPTTSSNLNGVPSLGPPPLVAKKSAYGTSPSTSSKTSLKVSG